MSVRRMRWYLGLSVFVTLAALAWTMLSGNQPVLGLDLQGGISITYEAVGKVKPGALDVARDIIDERVNSLGVAEPEISRQERTITVDLPGVKNRQEAARIVGQTGELRFRTVLAELPPEGVTPSSSTSTTAAPVAGAPTTPTTVAATTTTTLAAGDEAAMAAIAACDTATIQQLLASGAEIPSTSREEDTRDACVVLPSLDGESRLLLGPTKLTGSGVDGAKSRLQSGQGYVVDVSFTDAGATTFDQIAAESFGQAPPSDRVAIVLDGVVQSSPTFRDSSFSGDVEISGDFTADEASELAKVVNYGALPVRLEKLTTTDVSPTLGEDQLRAGIAAGLIGLVLVALYMVVYYRLLGLVVIAGLLMSGVITYALITFLGQEIGLALTLAGVTGIIVSIGVTVDSYVVYFERLKDEVRTGKTVRSSVDRGFTRSFRTIVAADLVSLIGAAALYLIAAGAVRGFAFFLGMSVLLDLVVAYFFMHPLVSLMARRPQLVRMRHFGIGAGLDAPEVTA